MASRYFSKGFYIFCLFFLFCSSLVAQNDFLVYGKVKLEDEVDTVRIEVRNKEKVLIKKLSEKNGEFEIFVKYGENLTVTFSYPGYLPLKFLLFLDLPDGVKECCFTPVQLNFHMIKPDGINDQLFKDPIYSIKYNEKYRNFNYDLDVDYKANKMKFDAAVARQNAIKDSVEYAKIKDSLDLENKYMDLINLGNLLYAANQFNLSKEYFEKALVLKPNRKYPKYKLEDIQTELEIFNKQADSLGVDVATLMPSVAKVDTVVEKPKEYIRLTDEEIHQKFLKDFYKNLEKNAKSKDEYDALVAYVSAKIEPPLELTLVENKSKDDNQVVKEKLLEITELPKLVSTIEEKPVQEKVEKPIVAPIKAFDEKQYQDSLLKKYPTTKTVEYEEDLNKKVTKVYINKNNYVTIYMEVKYSWGATFYFIDRTPFDPENISSSFFDYATNIEEK